MLYEVITEGQIASGSAQTTWPVSFAEMVRLNGTEAGGLAGIANDWQRFRSGVNSLAAALAEWDGFAQRRKDAERRGRLAGRGLAFRNNFV